MAHLVKSNFNKNQIFHSELSLNRNESDNDYKIHHNSICKRGEFLGAYKSFWKAMKNCELEPECNCLEDLGGKCNGNNVYIYKNSPGILAAHYDKKEYCTFTKEGKIELKLDISFFTR